MKHLILGICVCFIVPLYAQNTEAEVFRYADITYMLGGFSTKSKVEVDYGDTVFGWGKVADKLQDSTGKAIKFKTPVDALNWMSDQGWELVQSYQTTESQGLQTPFTYQHFIMRRKEPRKKP